MIPRTVLPVVTVSFSPWAGNMMPGHGAGKTSWMLLFMHWIHPEKLFMTA